MATIDRIYSRSLYDVAVEKNVLDEVYNNFIEFKELLKDNPEVMSFLKNPNILKSEKKEVLQQIFRGENILFKNYCGILIDKKRENLLIDSFKSFKELYLEHSNSIEAKLISANPLSEEKKSKLKNVLKNKLNKTIIFDEKIDPDLIMGFQIYVKDKLIDGSLKGSLESIAKTIKNQEVI